jgi:hypothetical protein
MFWLILGIIVIIITAIWLYWDERLWLDWGDYFTDLLLSSLVILLATVFLNIFTSAICSTEANIRYELEGEQKIIALNDNIAGEGNAYLLRGHYEEDLCYFYCVEDELGYKVNKIKADNTYVKYTDEDYRIEQYNPVFKNDILIFFASVPLEEDRYIIYCPEDTVIEKYEINLE